MCWTGAAAAKPKAAVKRRVVVEVRMMMIDMNGVGYRSTGGIEAKYCDRVDEGKNVSKQTGETVYIPTHYNRSLQASKPHIR